MLDLTMAVGVAEPGRHDRDQGDPPMHVRAEGGFHGDRATVGCVVNAMPFIVSRRRGSTPW